VRDEWNEAYSLIVPMAGLVVAIVGLSLTLIDMQRRSQAVGSMGPITIDVEVPRVRYSEGEIFVEARNPGEWRSLREFVQPYNTYLGAF